jgi:hypothetical protein
MKTRLFLAWVASALAASAAWAQGPPPPAFPGGQDPGKVMIVINAEERPAPAPLLPALVSRVAGWWQDAPPDAPPLVPVVAGPVPAPSRIWVDNEFLVWWIQGMEIPTLVSTSPPGTPLASTGVLGVAGNNSLYGPAQINGGGRVGWRLTAGGWLDDDRRYAVEANFLILANSGAQFSAGPPTILARPSIDATTGAPVAEPINVPGTVAGAIRISSTTSLVGGGIWFRENFHRSDDPCDTCHLCNRGGCCGGGGGCGGPACGPAAGLAPSGSPGGGGCGCDPSGWHCSFDSLLGYRYLRLGDHLAIDDLVTPSVPLNGLAAGVNVMRSDRFNTFNNFHGVDLGLTGQVRRGDFTLDILAKAALGFNNSSIDILGYRTTGGMPSAGGFLAQPTNMGHFTHTVATAVPEVGVKLGYDIRPNMKAYIGYSLLYWYHVARAGSQIDPTIDPSFLALGTPTGSPPINPQFTTTQERAIWVQGVSFGFEWRY